MDDQLQAAAPNDIRATVTRRNEGVRPSLVFYAEGKSPPSETTASLNNPAFLAAAKELNAYGETKCGIPAPKQP